MSTKNEVAGIGGWLVLLALGLVATPIKMCLGIYRLYVPLYEQYWAPLQEGLLELDFVVLVLSELVINSILLISWVYVLGLFFTKNRMFKKFYTVVFLVNIIYMILDQVAVSYIFPDVKTFDTEAVRTLARSFLVGMLWISYIHLSRRVANTFIR